MSVTKIPLVYRDSKTKEIPGVVTLLGLIFLVDWFFLHLALQGQAWAYGGALLVAVLLIYYVKLTFFCGYSLELNAEGMIYTSSRKKILEIPSQHIQTIEPHYSSGGNGQPALLPDAISITLKDPFRKRSLPLLATADYQIFGPYRGIFMMELIGVVRAWHEKYV